MFFFISKFKNYLVNHFRDTKSSFVFVRSLDETLITVTADHSHVFTIGGYPKRGSPVFGLVREVDIELAVDTQNRTYTTLGYMDGPGGLNGSRPDLRNVDTADKDYLQQATVLLDYESHGSEDVGKSVDYLVRSIDCTLE